MFGRKLGVNVGGESVARYGGDTGRHINLTLVLQRASKELTPAILHPIQINLN